MGPARRMLLWASENKWIEQRFRQSRFATRAVSRFMPGETSEAALRVATTLRDLQISTVATLLGEHISELSEAEVVANYYVDLLQEIQDAQVPTHLSVKPTQFGLELDAETTHAHLDRLLTQAAAHGNFVWIDMESSKDVDRTLTLFEQLRASHNNVGLCLQSYLRRTADDLERLLPLNPAIRLVKGAYNELPAVAFPKKKDVDASYLALAGRLLDAAAPSGGGLPAFGTHDMRIVNQINQDAAGRGLDRRSYEIQMLYGIERQHQRKLARDGYSVRVLISYGSAWFPWYVRRLAERPANVGFVIRSAFSR